MIRFSLRKEMLSVLEIPIVDLLYQKCLVKNSARAPVWVSWLVRSNGIAFDPAYKPGNYGLVVIRAGVPSNKRGYTKTRVLFKGK